jgi:hypothetical protein
MGTEYLTVWVRPWLSTTVPVTLPVVWMPAATVSKMASSTSWLGVGPLWLTSGSTECGGIPSTV